MNSTSTSLLDLEGTFYWSFRDEYFIETNEGNFIWSCPSQFGNNTIKRYEGTLKSWCKENEVPCCRNKGKKIIRDLTGNDVVVDSLLGSE